MRFETLEMRSRLVIGVAGAMLAVGGVLGVLIVVNGSDDAEAPAGDARSGEDDEASAGAGETPEEPVLYDLREQASGGSRDPVWSVAFSPDGSVLAAGVGQEGGGGVELWEVDLDRDREGDPVAALAHDAPVRSVAFSPDGSLLAAGTEAGSVSLWELETRESVGTISLDAPVESVAFSPEGDILATGTRDREIVEVPTGDERGTIGIPVGRGSVQLWDTATHEHIATLVADQPTYDVAFSPDGQTLAAGIRVLTEPGETSPTGPEVLLWDVPSTELVGELAFGGEHPGDVGDVAFSADGRVLAGGGLGSAVLWDLADREVVDRFDSYDADTYDPGSWVQAAVFTPDDRILAGGVGSSVSWWDLGDGTDACEVDPGETPPRDCWGQSGDVQSLAFSADGRYLASGDDDGSLVVLFDPSGFRS